MTFTGTPLSGELPDGAKWAALFGEVRPPAGFKTTTEAVNNNATLQNDDELVAAMAANAVYLVELDLVFNSGATPGFKFTFTLPAGAGGNLVGFAHNTANAFFTFNGTLTTVYSLAGLGANAYVHVSGYITTGATPGNAQIQWAQFTANASNTSVLLGSTLKLTRVS